MRVKLPDNVCLRVSHRCNACCGFCLAPSDGTTVDVATLKHRLDWLLSSGVRDIHFCGGEPTIHPALPELLTYLRNLKGKPKVTTNAIEITDEVLAAFRSTGTRVKVSLHGDRSHHNQMVGCDAFDRTVPNLKRLISAGIKPSVQTTVVAEGLWVLDWAIEFCMKVGVTKLTVLPFVPRGNGWKQREQFELRASQRTALHNQVREKRRVLGNRLDLRWLDISASRIHVVEPDGRIVLERWSEASDQLVCRIPPNG